MNPLVTIHSSRTTCGASTCREAEAAGCPVSIHGPHPSTSRNSQAPPLTCPVLPSPALSSPPPPCPPLPSASLSSPPLSCLFLPCPVPSPYLPCPFLPWPALSCSFRPCPFLHYTALLCLSSPVLLYPAGSVLSIPNTSQSGCDSEAF